MNKKSLTLAALAIFVIIDVALAVYVLAGDSKTEKQATATAPTKTPAATTVGTPAASLSPTLVPTAVPTATTLPDRQDCAAIRGTDYRSAAERQWFIANCQVIAAPTVSRLPAATPPAPTTSVVQDIVVEVAGTVGLSFNGTIGSLNDVRTVSGSVPQTYTIKPQMGSAAVNLQKGSAFGTLTVILRCPKGQVSRSTNAANGVVSIVC